MYGIDEDQVIGKLLILVYKIQIISSVVILDGLNLETEIQVGEYVRTYIFIFCLEQIL